jgi:hypothetical protein
VLASYDQDQAGTRQLGEALKKEWGASLLSAWQFSELGLLSALRIRILLLPIQLAETSGSVLFSSKIKHT